MFGSYGGGSSLIAAEQSLELESIEVIGSSEQDVKDKKISEIKKTSKELDKQQVSDSRDLVKYETGISVVETGRMGASGYSIRGVDENRVDISIDGLKQAETISSQGFKDLFEGYGNFNNTRNSVEMETVKQVNITKGADSIKAGSGALGGSVMFETKDARDYLLEKDWHYGFKVGHSSANSERMHSHTLAARAKWFDVLVIKTDRDGSETKNYGYSSYDDSVTGKLRERVDPYHIKKESTLLKFGFQFNETNRFNIAYDNSKNRNQGTDWSNILTQISRGSGGQSNSYISDKIRHTDDSVERKNLNFSYENYDETPFWDSLKISYSKQKINLRAKTDEYCDGKKCIDIQNPSGIQLKNGKIVDKYGGEFGSTSETYKTIQDSTARSAYTEEEFKKDLADAKASGVKLAPNFEEDLKSYIGKSYTDPYYSYTYYTKPKVIDQTDYIITDSKGKALAEGMAGDYKTLTSRDLKVDCNKYPNLCTSGITAFSTSTRSYKKYDLKPNANGIASLDNNTDSILLPPSLGYLQNLWKDRSLKTDTKQFNIDATKDFDTKEIQHSLSYGLLFAKSDKSMVNKSGISYKSIQWWSDEIFKEAIVPYQAPDESFLMPVKTKNGALYLADDMQINDYLGLNLSYRYDKIKHTPHYIPGVSPKIPDDMVRGSMIPLEEYKLAEPNYNDFDKCMSSYCSEPEYEAAKAAYKAEVARVDAINATNVERNFKALQQPKKFSNSSYAIALTYDPLDYLRIQTKYSTAFRAPTSDELYFTFMHPDFAIRPNTNLKKEDAKTKEIALTLYEAPSFITLNLFRTDYKNFIDLGYIGERQLAIENGRYIGRTYSIYQNLNRDKAKVNGLEINSKLFLDQIYEPLKGFSLGYKVTYQKGRMHVKTHHIVKQGNKILKQYHEDVQAPMNAIQPVTHVYSASYISSSKKFGADMYITHAKAKSANDTYDMHWYGSDKDNSQVKWRSESYTLVDMIGFYSPIKNLTFRAGVYNIFDKKYLTWEAARSIRTFGAANLIDQETGKGINRFYSPGRNFKLTFEMTF